MEKKELLAGYILGDLGPEEQQEFVALLRDNPELSQELEYLQETLDSLPYTLPEPEPSSQLRGTLLEAAARTLPVAQTPRLRLVRSFSPWLAAAASIAVVIVGVDSYRVHQELAQTQSQLGQQVAITQMLWTSGTHLVTFKPMDTKTGASGSMVVTPGDTRAVLVLREVTPIPSHQVYRLWATVDGKKQICGEFTPDAKGEVWVKVPVDETLSKMPLVVTLESINAPMEPTGPMILTSSS